MHIARKQLKHGDCLLTGMGLAQNLLLMHDDGIGRDQYFTVSHSCSICPGLEHCQCLSHLCCRKRSVNMLFDIDIDDRERDT